MVLSPWWDRNIFQLSSLLQLIRFDRPKCILPTSTYMPSCSLFRTTYNQEFLSSNLAHQVKNLVNLGLILVRGRIIFFLLGTSKGKICGPSSQLQKNFGHEAAVTQELTRNSSVTNQSQNASAAALPKRSAFGLLE